MSKQLTIPLDEMLATADYTLVCSVACDQALLQIIRDARARRDNAAMHMAWDWFISRCVKHFGGEREGKLHDQKSVPATVDRGDGREAKSKFKERP